METKPQIQFQQGKWYKAKGIGHFAKCLRYENDVMYASELKITDYQNLGEYPFCEGYTWVEATQEELKEFLPEGHPDLIQNSSTMKKDTSEAKFKIGEVVNTTDKGWQHSNIEGIRAMSYMKSNIRSNKKIINIRFSNMYQNFWYMIEDELNWYSECALEPIEVKQIEETITPKFKPGDKVEFISSGSPNAIYFKKGLTNLEIKQKDSRSDIGRWIVYESDKSTSWFVRENELQLISSSETIIPQGGIDMLDIQRQCKEKFPIGSIVKNTSGDEHCIIEDGKLYRIVENYIYSSDDEGCLYEDGKWATLVSLPKLEEDVTFSEKKFKKGDYVVLLAGCSGGNTWAGCIPINHCYKLVKDYDLFNFQIELDTQGSRTNGWISKNKSYPSKLEVRAATKEEIEHYEKIKKPYNVSILKTTKEPITNSTSLIGRYLKALVDRPNSGAVKKDEIGIIINVYSDGTPSCANFPSQSPYGITSNTYKDGKSYELMPEGFIPDLQQPKKAIVPKLQERTPKFKIRDKVTVKDSKFDTTEDGWRNNYSCYNKVNGVAYDIGYIVKIIPTEQGIYYRLSCHDDGSVKEEMLELTHSPTEEIKSEPKEKEKEEDFIVGGYIRLLRNYKGVPKESIVQLTSLSGDKSLAYFINSFGGKCYIGYNLETETDLLIKPKKETENKKTRFDEQEFLSNPFNKEFEISKVKPKKKKTVLNFN